MDNSKFNYRLQPPIPSSSLHLHLSTSTAPLRPFSLRRTRFPLFPPLPAILISDRSRTFYFLILLTKTHEVTLTPNTLTVVSFNSSSSFLLDVEGGGQRLESLTVVAGDWKLRLERDPNGTIAYIGDLVSNIDEFNVDRCNLLLIEALILDLGYTSNVKFVEGDDEVVDQPARNKDEGSVDQANVEEVNNNGMNACPAEGQNEDNNQIEEPINPSTHEGLDRLESDWKWPRNAKGGMSLSSKFTKSSSKQVMESYYSCNQGYTPWNPTPYQPHDLGYDAYQSNGFGDAYYGYEDPPPPYPPSKIEWKKYFSCYVKKGKRFGKSKNKSRIK
ncbi:hypothetical protein PIB30_023396 [Stylosanthes scabra]|uniref:PB1-like domain-containing protein n=1 Tax=Stylosanthes scabra TaxID=79078 RepID=A0ABU6WAF5_9FABA|nr:hypothetical protein [Stylosanthes scabra]